MSVVGDFNATARPLWRDAKVRTLPADARSLFVYLLTNPDRTSEGFYALPTVLLIADLGWESKRVERALDALRAAGLADYDPAAQVVLIVKGLKFNPPRGSKTVAAAVKQLDAAHGAPDLFWRFLAAADRYAPEFAAAVRGRYGMDGASGGDVQARMDRSSSGSRCGDGDGAGVGAGSSDPDPFA